MFGAWFRSDRGMIAVPTASRAYSVRLPDTPTAFAATSRDICCGTFSTTESIGFRICLFLRLFSKVRLSLNAQVPTGAFPFLSLQAWGDIVPTSSRKFVAGRRGKHEGNRHWYISHTVHRNMYG